MKRLISLSLLISCFFTVASAQQASQYSLYMLNPLRWNPAYAGMEDAVSITGMYRQQWVGLEGSPTSQIVSAHMPLFLLRGGIGIQLENDEIGASRRTQAGISYNYQQNLGAGKLSIGARADWLQWNLDGNILRTPGGFYSPLDGVLDHNDDILAIFNQNATTTTFGVGVYYKDEVIEGGFSVENISEPVLEIGDLNFPLSRTYYASIAARLDLTETIRILPSIWMRSDAIQTQVDFSVLIRYNDNIFGGASLRGYNNDGIDALSIIAGFRLSDKIQVAYAYDVGLSTLRGAHSGSHEIGLKYDLPTNAGKGQLPPIIYHPRTKQ